MDAATLFRASCDKDRLGAGEDVGQAAGAAARSAVDCAILDDDQDVVLTLVAALAELGVKAELFIEVESFLEHVASRAPQLVVLDLMLGERDGIEVLGELARGGFAGKVVLVSRIDPKIVQIARTAGLRLGLEMLPSLPKPFEPEALHRVLTTPGPDEPGGISELDIDRAIGQREFVAHFQPKVALDSGRIDGAEALVRWEHPTEGLLTPAAFLPLMSAEQLDELTGYMTERAIFAAEALIAAGTPLPISVNISARQIWRLDLIGLINRLRKGRWTQPALVLEITETEAMDDVLLGEQLAARLRLQGVELSIDDFGVGFSSLARLRALPINELKIDRSFVAEVEHKPEDEAIVRSVAFLGRNLGIRVVAEGVESQAALDLVTAAGCSHAQGFLLSRPLPLDALLQAAEAPPRQR